MEYRSESQRLSFWRYESEKKMIQTSFITRAIVLRVHANSKMRRTIFDADITAQGIHKFAQQGVLSILKTP